MKTYATILFFLFALSSFAQRDKLSSWDRAIAEGMPLQGIQGSWSGTVASGASAGQAPLAGTTWIVDNVSVSCDDAARIAVQFTNTGITPGSVVPPYWGIVFGTGGGRADRHFGRSLMGQTGINVSFLAAQTNPNFALRWSVSGMRVSADFEKEAERTFLVIGDSFSEGSSVSRSDECWQFIVLDSLEKYTRKSWRIIHKAKGGFRSSDADQMFQQGMLYVPTPPNLIYVALGTNDTDATAYENNLARLLRRLVATYKYAVIIVCAPAVRTDLSSQEMTNVLIRLAAARQVAAINKPNVALVNWGDGWNSTNATTYLHADKIHPIAAGHAVIAGLAFAPFLNGKTLLNLVK